MVGKSKSKEEQEIVARESKLYHDLVQGDYKDSYKLLAYKALNALYWVDKNCAHIPWTIHADDDVMINDFRLITYLKYLESHKPETPSIYCHLFKRPKVMRRGKWKIPFKKFRNKFYPDYCLGPFWLMQTQYIPRLLNSVNTTRFIWIDDVYITGLLAKNAGIDRVNMHDLAIDYSFKKDKYNKISWLSTNENRFSWWNNITKRYLHSNFTEITWIPFNLTSKT